MGSLAGIVASLSLLSTELLEPALWYVQLHLLRDRSHRGRAVVLSHFDDAIPGEGFQLISYEEPSLVAVPDM